MSIRQQIGIVIGVAALALWAGGNARAAGRIPDEYRVGGFAIGCEAYTFNHYTAFEAIEKTAEAGGHVIEFFPGQSLSPDERDVKVDYTASDETINKLKDKLKECNVMAVNFGVVALPNDEAECRKVFEFAKKMGMVAITSEPSEDALDVIEKLAKEYDINVAIHNHPRQPNNPNYKVWDPNYVLSLVKDRDHHLGACADTGHWMRSGINPVLALKILKGRIISSHLKDLNTFGPDAHDVPYGTGQANIPAILDELKSQGFDGNISIEYEYHWTNSLPEVAQCIGFVRGYSAAKY
ncbi:MAG: sugar phosphate isomerase/epimerase [Candidatus Omnitrophica bacterium]|nr:sugar phosphate isomerase/epimerase [Candidatus Omnitrophota bacterium]